MKQYLSHILITSTILTFCTLTTIVLYAAIDAERKTVKDKQKALNDLKLTIIDQRTRTRDSFAALTEQRTTLKEKIKTARTDFMTNKNALRNRLQMVSQELTGAIDKFKSVATSDLEKTEANKFMDQANKDLADTSKSIDDFALIEQPLEI